MVTRILLVTETLDQVQGMCLGCTKDRLDGKGSGEGLHCYSCDALKTFKYGDKWFSSSSKALGTFLE